MSCPVHGFFAQCKCGYARFHRLSCATACVYLVALCLVACGAFTPAPCSATDVEMAAKAADCVARVGVACKGIPLDEPCPFEEECKAYSRERCK